MSDILLVLSAQRTRKNIISGKYIIPSKERAREAAVKIQRYWRFYHLLRRTKARTQKLHFLIGAVLNYQLLENVHLN